LAQAAYNEAIFREARARDLLGAAKHRSQQNLSNQKLPDADIQSAAVVLHRENIERINKTRARFIEHWADHFVTTKIYEPASNPEQYESLPRSLKDVIASAEREARSQARAELAAKYGPATRGRAYANEISALVQIRTAERVRHMIIDWGSHHPTLISSYVAMEKNTLGRAIDPAYLPPLECHEIANDAALANALESIPYDLFPRLNPFQPFATQCERQQPLTAIRAKSPDSNTSEQDQRTLATVR
jgi:hypothetical protein